MSLLVPNEGEVEMLKRTLNVSTATDLVIHLYSNDEEPGEGSIITDFTELTTNSDGNPDNVTLIPSNWSITTDGGNNITTAAYPEISFDFSSAAESRSCYGYYITTQDSSSNDVLFWAEKFADAPYNIPNGGGTIKVTPKIELD